jgi:recombination protein RecA
MYGSPETTPGGRALKFFASVRMRVSRGEAIKNGTEQIGNRTKVRVDKNKIAPPFREAEFDLIYGRGISKYGDILDHAVGKGLIQKTGAWFTCGDERFQGRDNVRQYLEENPTIADALELQIRDVYGLNARNGHSPDLNGVIPDDGDDEDDE